MSAPDGAALELRAPGRRWALRLVVLAAIVAVAIVVVRARDPGAVAVPYRTAPVERVDLVVTAAAPGRLEIVDPILVPAPFSGFVAEVRVEEDQVLAAGELLAVLAPGQLDSDAVRAEAEARTALARVEEAKVAVRTADEALARARELRGSGLASADAENAVAAEARRARASLTTATAAARAARATADGARSRAARVEVRAPAAGTLIERRAVPGGAIEAGAPLFVIAPRLDVLRLVAEVDEADVSRVGPESTAVFTVPAWPDRTFEARFERLRTAATHSPGGGVTYAAWLRCDNAERRLRPGMSAAVTLTVARLPAALTAPEAALRWRPGATGPARRTVHKLVDGRPVSVPVVPGMSDGIRTEVSGELREGELVIVGTRAEQADVLLGGAR